MKKFQHLCLMHYGAAVIRRKTKKTRESVSDSLTSPCSHRDRHFWRNMWFESRDAKVLSPPSVPRPYIDFQFSQIFSISLSCPCCSLYSSILSIFDATSKAPSSPTKLRDTYIIFNFFFFPIKLIPAILIWRFYQYF